ncbi:hypothetical protein DVJ83_02510 [Deinococcus wulumuqiensis]|uniref:Uncharacterized protein n=1 Tax=Deinococcus wulumuqiensis TaxID=980427 RepID=A0A345IEU3_9DEIO|nr:hypothetical protein [Deinococcus wulumuqiensis]AXG98215.1 hypothetical protein DVJ83_02510 [Deinococcus wulumuqiensis]
MSLALLLTACGGDKTPNADFKTLSGTLVEADFNASGTNLVTKAWTGGAGTVKLVSASASASGDNILSTGTLQANGAFSVQLQAPTKGLEAFPVKDLDTLANAFITSLLDMDVRQALNCSGQPTVSDMAAQTALGGLKVDAGKDGYAFPMTVAGSENQSSGSLVLKMGLMMYADRPVNVTGSQVCTASVPEGRINYTTNYNLRLGQGWNKMTISSTLASQGGSPSVITITNAADSGSFPSDTWVFMNSGTGFGQSLSLKSLNLPTLR